MTARTVTRPTTTPARTDRNHLSHVYDPYSFTPDAFPPSGARALCGHIAPGGIAEAVPSSAPNACKVCLDLAEGIKR